MASKCSGGGRAPLSAPGAPPLPTTARHPKLRLRQRSAPKGIDDAIEPATDLRHYADAGVLQRDQQPLRDASTDHPAHAQLPQAANYSLRLPLIQHDFLALHLGLAFEANQHHPRRHIKDR